MKTIMKPQAFLLGNWHNNSGASNVNLSFVQVNDGRLAYIKHKHGIMRRLERIIKILFYQRIIVSGGELKLFEYYLMKYLHKDIYYYIHGDVRYENAINHVGISESTLRKYDDIINMSKKIIAVSENFAEWLKNRYPHYANKIVFINNSLSLKQREKTDKETLTIAIAGGNRRIKNNEEVCLAVSDLQKEGYDIQVYSFGAKSLNNSDLTQFHFVKEFGQLGKVEYYRLLDKIALFIINSEIETFGLVIADALNCHCSLLMSEGVGGRRIMKTQEQDIIHNPHDIQEIKEKIKYAFEHSNSERLFQSIDKSSLSPEYAYKRLMDIIANE